MAINLGTGVSRVVEDQGYDYDMVVFQKEKPILDTELNLVQQLQNGIDQKKLSHLASGWLTSYSFKTDSDLTNSFYTQDPTNPKPELALVNGMVVHVTSTNNLSSTIADNLNRIDLGTAPVTGNVINGVFLEVWRALLDPDFSDGVTKPSPLTQIDGLRSIYMFNSNMGWACGENGLILGTTNGGITWNVKNSGTVNRLNGVNFLNSNKGYAVGDNGTIISTSSSGESWVPIASPTVYNLNSVFVYDVSNAWAVGDSGTILKTMNGVTWLIKTSGVISDLNKVFFYNQNIGWAVGANGVILKTTNGGTTWLAQTSGVTAELNSVYFYDLNYGFAVGVSGTILRSSDGGATWIAPVSPATVNLNDVTIFPSIDVGTNEEVSLQLNGTSKTFIVSNIPITLGDGKGTTLTYPDSNAISVTVNGVPVVISSVDGATGTVVLDQVPGACDHTIVNYYYRKPISAVFSGQAWIVGDNGKVYYTIDAGQTWVDQTGSAFADRNLRGIYFLDQYKGWAVGDSATVIHTENSGTTWTLQSSAVLSRQVQRIFYEGNIGTTTLLPDNSIHPDAAVQTTKRVQVQYKIRVVSGVDPDSNPEAGLSTNMLGMGPNQIGTLFPYENMGISIGDYGLWRAQCSNTVDGYCWAIPMFFVSRRNSSDYNATSNANGQYSVTALRPDLLLASQVADSDILDVRRRVIVPSISEMLNSSLDLLLGNQLQTRLMRETTGGERYSTDMLQIDLIAGAVGDPGTQISATLSDALFNISSEGSIVYQTMEEDRASTFASESVFVLPSGTEAKYHPDFSHYKAIYSLTGITLPGKPVPGYFERISDTSVKFVYAASASAVKCTLTAAYIKPNSRSLTYIPSNPLLVTNYEGGSTNKHYYQGVSNTVDSRVLTEWDSGIVGYKNYVLVYSAKDASDTAQCARGSSVELHRFLKIGDAACSIITVNKIEISLLNLTYSIYGVSRINNIQAGFPYRIKDSFNTGGATITVESESGYEFISGTIIEVISGVVSANNVVENGSSVTFDPRIKGIGNFTESYVRSSPNIIKTGVKSFRITENSYNIMGLFSSDTTGGLSQLMCWSSLNTPKMQQIVSISGIGTNTVDATVVSAFATSTSISAQVMLQRDSTTSALPFTATGSGLTIAYDHVPYQSVNSLSDSLTVEIQQWPNSLFVSNLGTGGGTTGEPYTNPLESIPVNDILLTTDGYFQNKDTFRFNGFSIDTGLVQLPITIPGRTGNTITLSVSASDAQSRTFYSSCSRNLLFEAEGLQVSEFRKIFMPAIAKVTSASDGKFLPGEYVMVIFSKTSTYDAANSTGMMNDSNYVTAVYRLPNKPLSKV